MSKDIPEWAIERAKSFALSEPNTGGPLSWVDYHLAFARYIAEHEKPPVDPLLIEAREICARRHSKKAYAEQYRKGECDNEFVMKVALAALKRGMELAKAGEA